jgi:amino acid transporter
MSGHPVPPAADGELPRRLGPWHAVGLVVGITIGSGIFRTPAVIADRVPEPVAMLAVWLIGGLISLCGALSVAELAASFPRTGGWYVFLREGWGRLPAFLFGWSELVLIRASATGAIALVFSSYLLRSLGWDGDPGESSTRLLAAATIVLTAAANIRGVRLGAALTGASSLAKFAALALLVVVAFAIGDRHGANLSHFARTDSAIDAGRFGLALVSVLWAYDGFADVSFAAGEVRDPQRTLPRAIVGGLLAIIAIYVAANIAYLYVLPIGDIARSSLIAADTMRALAGSAGGTFVSLVVAFSTFGSLSGIMLAAPRIFFAMAAEGLFFRAIGGAHPRYQTPHRAIMLSAALGVAFVLTRTFEQLADTFVLAIWPFYGIAVAGLYRLRRSRGDELGSYRTPGFPLVPAIFIAGVTYLVGNAVAVDPIWTLATFAIVLAGVPAYYLFFARPRWSR